MSPSLPFSLDRRWAARWLAGLVLLTAALVLAWPADAKQRGADGERMPDDLKLVPADSTAFVTVRVADLLNCALVKQLIRRTPQSLPAKLAALEKTLGVPLTDIERLTVLRIGPRAKETEVFTGEDGRLLWKRDPRIGPRAERAVIVRTKDAYNREKVLGEKPRKWEVSGKAFYDRLTGESVYLAAENVFVLGGAHLVDLVTGGVKGSGPLTAALQRAAKKHHVVLGVQPAAVLP